MQIDIRCEPPVGMFLAKSKYVRNVVVLLGVIVCAVLLGVYLVVTDTPHGDLPENLVLALFVGAVAIFCYYAEKLHDYRLLTEAQAKELETLCVKHPEIAAYCERVAKTGRKTILAEYEACQAHGEKLPDPKG